MSIAQRPVYAPRPQRYPQVHDRYTTTTIAPSVGLGDRAGGITTTTVRLPIDARGDADLVNQIAKWPKEHQPYWYLNWQQIEAARAQAQPVAPGSQSQQQQPSFATGDVASRSSFLRRNRK